MKFFVRSTFLFLFCLFSSFTPGWAGAVKYVFFFIGDGMGSTQIQATEAFLAAKNAEVKSAAGDRKNTANRLGFTSFPVVGLQNTSSAESLVTDSAAAVTALACGGKTTNGVLGMAVDKTSNFVSIARLAHQNGRRIGILSSVSLDNATPAGYYASAIHRSHTNRIASQLPLSGFEFFGGGGFVTPQAGANQQDSANNVPALLAQHGYKTIQTPQEIHGLAQQPATRLVVTAPVLDDGASMPYAIDQKKGELTLADITDAAITALTHAGSGDGRNGFFMMVEGGKIDWACHANDPATAVNEVLDFDRAVRRALAFYDQHAEETLIVVTGDHETGGMSIGQAATEYAAYPERLLGQRISVARFGATVWKEHAQKIVKNASSENTLAADSQMTNYLQQYFGLVWTDLTEKHKKLLEDAYQLSIKAQNQAGQAESGRRDDRNQPFLGAISRVQSERAGIGWTTSAHTGAPLPVFALGQESSQFDGFYENTEIAVKLARAMGIKANLPVIESLTW